MSDETKVTRGSGNVFADLGYPDAATHKTKAELVDQIRAIMRERNMTQTEAATRTGLSQPDISRLLSGKFRDVSVDRLMGALTGLDAKVFITVRRGDLESEAIHYACA